MSAENRISLTIGREERETIDQDGHADFFGWDPILGSITIRVTPSNKHLTKEVKK